MLVSIANQPSAPLNRMLLTFKTNFEQLSASRDSFSDRKRIIFHSSVHNTASQGLTFTGPTQLQQKNWKTSE
jgi:hypothetical protein